jgi:hypothetical protein
VISWTDAALWGYTVVACTSAYASVTHERALETHELSCLPRAAKPFFYSYGPWPVGVVGHVAAPELHSQQGRAPSRGTHGTTGALLSGRQSPGTRGGSGVHLYREVWSETTAYVAARGYTA